MNTRLSSEVEMHSDNMIGEEYENLRAQLFNTTGTDSYELALEKTQKHLSHNINRDMVTLSEDELKESILKYITDYNITCSLTSEPLELSNYIYHDMAGQSFISREKLFDIKDFEELDVNAWNDVDIIIDGKRTKTDYSFLNPRHASDIMRRMLQHTKTLMDDTMPYAITDLGKSIRIAALKSPVVDEEVGISCSIRKVSGSTISREMLLKTALTEEMLGFLNLCIHHGVSVCFSGGTGSGKTTLSGFLLSEVAKELRMFTIEEGSREWDFRHYDANNKVTNSVVHMKTRPTDDDRTSVTQNKGLQIALRFNPDVIGVGEMRSDEAYAAAEASNTGHTVVSTVHADSAAKAPKRIVGLCKKAYDFSDDTLMDLVANAFPIHVYQAKSEDGIRRVTEIIEVLDYADGKIQYNTLVEFFVEDNVIDPITKEVTKVIGDFVWRNPVSQKLHQKMLKKGATKAELVPFLNIQKNDRL